MSFQSIEHKTSDSRAVQVLAQPTNSWPPQGSSPEKERALAIGMLGSISTLTSHRYHVGLKNVLLPLRHMTHRSNDSDLLKMAADPNRTSDKS